MPFFYTTMTARAEGIDDDDGDDYIFLVDTIFAGTPSKAIEKLKQRAYIDLRLTFPEVKFDSEKVEKSSFLQWLGARIKD